MSLCFKKSHLAKNICPPSKAAILILIWSCLIGAIFNAGLSASAAAGLSLRRHNNHIMYVVVLAPYITIAIALILYPLSGFLADVYCGRYKAVIFSLYCLCIMLLLVSVNSGLLFEDLQYKGHEKFRQYVIDAFIMFAAVGFGFLIIGFGTFQANYIQLGLDQLMEAPTKHLGLFIHWLVWCDSLGASIIQIFFSMYQCTYSNTNTHIHMRNAVCALPPVLFALLVIVLILNGCYSHQWFYSDRGHSNPYKMVCGVLNFARKHKCPICRSALTYYDGREPSRLDFAKEWYGGPFKSEEVEDVKTFVRVLLVLLALGPVFVLEVPSSYFMLPLFSVHTGDNSVLENITCTKDWIFLKSGNLKYTVSVLVFPVYILWIYSLFPKQIPKILRRLWFGVVLYILGVFTMLVTDLVGHLTYKVNGKYRAQCMFSYDIHQDHPEPLHMHWSVTIPPNIILGIAPSLIYSSAFEFISAQSPQPMKGFLVGMFFAIKGLFQILSALVLVPFSHSDIWYQREYVANCAFGYFVFTIAVALIGLILLTVVSNKYKYRHRGEDPYGQVVVEDVYNRYSIQEGNNDCDDETLPINNGCETSYEATDSIPFHF